MQTEYEAQVEAVWKTCPAKLEALHVDKKQARSVIGKWLKNAPPQKVMEAICAAEKIGTLDPIPYVTEALKTGKPVRKAENGKWLISKGTAEWDAWREFRQRNRDEALVYSMDHNEQLEFRTRWPSRL
jgi:hypothetical protein